MLAYFVLAPRQDRYLDRGPNAFSLLASANGTTWYKLYSSAATVWTQ